MVSQAPSSRQFSVECFASPFKVGDFSPMNGRVARFVIRIQSAAVALMRDHNAALEALRLVNRELLVTAMGEVPEQVAAKCDEARGHVLEAVRLLAPLPPGGQPTFEELPPAEHRALIARGGRKFSPLTDPPGQN